MDAEAITNILRQACLERKVCKLHIKGEPEDRIINPHGVCYSTKHKEIIVCILVQGYSESKNPYSNFRNLLLEKCESAEMTSRSFTVDPDFNPDDPQYNNWRFHVLMKYT